ncbi:MAG TPA: MFS transporter [Syntrophorhabdaceae bacterium]|nr:MFS transporter [Syntrophorhabdaceae bacterium]
MQTSSGIFKRDFILVFFAQIAFNSVERLLVPTLPIYLKNLNSAEFQIGILIGAFGLASVFSRPFSGRMLAKISEKTFMLIGASLYIISSLAYIVFLPFWPFLFVRILQGVGFGFFHTASTTYVVNITEASKRARVLAYLAISMNIASAVAPPLGIVIADRAGFTCLFLICAAVSICMFCISSVLKRSRLVTASPGVSASTGSAIICKQAIPASIICLSSLFLMTSTATFYPLHARSFGIANPGLFFTVVAVVLVLSRTLGGRILDIPNRKIVIIPAILISMIGTILLALFKTQPIFLVAGGLLGLGQGFLMASLMAFALEQSRSQPGPVVATFFAFADTGMFIGPLIMGVVAQNMGYPAVFLSLFIVCLMSLMYFWYIAQRHGDREHG